MCGRGTSLQALLLLLPHGCIHTLLLQQVVMATMLNYHTILTHKHENNNFSNTQCMCVYECVCVFVP